MKIDAVFLSAEARRYSQQVCSESAENLKMKDTDGIDVSVKT